MFTSALAMVALRTKTTRERMIHARVKIRGLAPRRIEAVEHTKLVVAFQPCRTEPDHAAALAAPDAEVRCCHGFGFPLVSRAVNGART